MGIIIDKNIIKILIRIKETIDNHIINRNMIILRHRNQKNQIKEVYNKDLLIHIQIEQNLINHINLINLINHINLN